jgi:CyaY protein
MDEGQFNAMAEATLDAIEQALEICDADLDYEVKPGGVLEIEFDDSSRVIINRHSAAREIWVAARSGGFHFRPVGERWLGTRDGEELFAALSRVISEQARERIVLAPPG